MWTRRDALGRGPTGNAMQGPLTANRRPSGVSGQCFGSPLAPTDSLGHWTALAAGQYADEMENYQLAGSQVLRQGMGVGCKGESLDVMQKPGWVVCPDAGRGLDFGPLDSSHCLFSFLLVTGRFTRY